jgi:hypothetical protein
MMKPDEIIPHKLDIYSERIALSIRDAAMAIGRTPSYLYQEQRAGRIKFCKPNRPNADSLILVEDLKKWVRGETPSPA